jgi:hypothetical protein
MIGKPPMRRNARDKKTGMAVQGVVTGDIRKV